MRGDEGLEVQGAVGGTDGWAAEEAGKGSEEKGRHRSQFARKVIPCPCCQIPHQVQDALHRMMHGK